MSREQIAAKLKELRKRSGMTAEQVGNIVGKSGKTVSSYESGHRQPDADTLLMLCKVYNVTDILSEFEGRKTSFALTSHEQEVILAYRSHPSVQCHIDKLLDIDSEVGEQKKRA